MSVMALVGAALVSVGVPAQAAAPKTIVSLTFDDGNDNQMAAEQVLKAHGLVGTFFITTGWIGQPSWLTRSQLNTIAADGNEIGGHTVTHPHLTTVSAATAKAEVCDGRATLQSWGFNAANFAYPFADENASVESIVKSCGYSSARSLGDIKSPASCANCPVAATLPPGNPYATFAPDEVDSTWTLATLQGLVTSAESTGGWLQLAFHHIAVGTDPTLTISPSIFEQFVVWLAARTANGTTSVQTVAQALGQSPSPSPGPSSSPSPSPTPTPPPVSSGGPAAIAAKAAAMPMVGSSAGSVTCGLASAGCYQAFAAGQIHWSAATGAHVTTGAIDGAWGAQGWENGSLGYPITDEVTGLRGGGVYQAFQGGQIHWSAATGARITRGGIDSLWASQGWENGPLGYPTTNEISGLKAGGVYQAFQGGVAYWSPATGAHSNGGAIRTAYASQGWENGRLGYPTSNEYATGGAAVAQDFQGGRITWTAGAGTAVAYQ